MDAVMDIGLAILMVVGVLVSFFTLGRFMDWMVGIEGPIESEMGSLMSMARMATRRTDRDEALAGSLSCCDEGGELTVVEAGGLALHEAPKT